MKITKKTKAYLDILYQMIRKEKQLISGEIAFKNIFKFV